MIVKICVVSLPFSVSGGNNIVGIMKDAHSTSYLNIQLYIHMKNEQRITHGVGYLATHKRYLWSRGICFLGTGLL